MERYLASSLLAACGLFGLTEQAGAVAIERMLAAADAPQLAVGRSMLVFAGTPQATACETASAPASARIASNGFAQAPPRVGPAQPSKASAILGGGVSAFDRIRQEQAAQARTAAQVNLTLSARPGEAASSGAGMAPGAGLAPGAGPLSPIGSVPGVGCNGFALPRAALAIAPGRSLPFTGGDDFLQTRRLAVSRTAFDGQWARVSRQGVSPQFLSRHAELGRLVHGRANMAAVTAINAWTNRRIRFVEDAKQFGAADYWAPAQTTLKLGAGDCEDIAITKMQLLAAAGVPRSDMYLTIARDLARHADHALLVVRMDGRHWLLDNSTDRVLDAQASYDYQPVLSFSEGRKWLHGAVVAMAD